jgi:hypothetical protein
MYKAVFELSTNRADFVSRLFSRERPAGLGPQTTVQELLTKYETAKPAGELYDANVRMVRERLVNTHGFPLTPDDLEWIESCIDDRNGRQRSKPQLSCVRDRILVRAGSARGKSDRAACG